MTYRLCLLPICAILLGTTPAATQYFEVPNTPRAAAAGIEIGVWMVYTQVGFTLIVAEKQVSGWVAIATTEPYLSLGDFEAVVKKAGGATAWIEQQLPILNAGIARRFQQVAESKSATPAQPPILDQVNATLMSTFKIVVGPDGIPRLVKK